MPRISLRQLFLVVTAIALAIVSLKYASPAWLTVVGAIAMLSFFVALNVAAADRGPRQVFAIGMTLTMIGYSLIVSN